MSVSEGCKFCKEDPGTNEVVRAVMCSYCFQEFGYFCKSCLRGHSLNEITKKQDEILRPHYETHKSIDLV